MIALKMGHVVPKDGIEGVDDGVFDERGHGERLGALTTAHKGRGDF